MATLPEGTGILRGGLPYEKGLMAVWSCVETDLDVGPITSALHMLMSVLRIYALERKFEGLVLTMVEREGGGHLDFELTWRSPGSDVPAITPELLKRADDTRANLSGEVSHE